MENTEEEKQNIRNDVVELCDEMLEKSFERYCEKNW